MQEELREMKCALCGEIWTRDGQKLISGELICEYCADESAQVWECDICRKWFWAKDIIMSDKNVSFREIYVRCHECLKYEVEVSLAFYLGTMAKVNQSRHEKRLPVLSAEEYVEFAVAEINKDASDDDTGISKDITGRTVKRLAIQLIRDGWGWKRGN
jgi:hypothetical protein